LFAGSFSFLLWLGISAEHEKARWRWSPAGLGVSFDLSGRLAQAMAVRRHGYSMMVVMAVMAEGLHLSLKL
jgi:hypothetical protein